MKTLKTPLLAIGLLTVLPLFAAETPTPVPAAIAQHQGPIRIAVIRNLGSDDNTTQFSPVRFRRVGSWALRSIPFSAMVMMHVSKIS